MKKLIAIAVVFALVAGAAFAQTANGIQVQAWGRGAFSPLVVDGPEQKDGKPIQLPGKDGGKLEDVKGEVYTGVGPTWGGDKARIDIRINGNSDYVGFAFNGTFEGYGWNDNAANIWAKPLGSDILKLTVGAFVDDTLRGKIGNLDDGFSNFVLPGGVREEDPIFSRFGFAPEAYATSIYTLAPHSYMISSAPMDGLFIGLAVNGAIHQTPAANAFRYMQLGAGYNIANIGHARAQYIGGWSGTIDLDSPTDDQFAHWVMDDPTAGEGPNKPTDKPARIELAFALTAVDNLLVDLGTKIWLPLEIKKGPGSATFNKGLDLSLGATYNFSALGISALGLGARLDIAGLGAYGDKPRAKDDDKHEVGATTVIRLVPTYALEGFTVGLDFAVMFKGKDKDDEGKDKDKSDGSQVGFGVFVLKDLGNGNIRAGLSFTGAPVDGDGKAQGSARFQIPIILTYAFF